MRRVTISFHDGASLTFLTNEDIEPGRYTNLDETDSPVYGMLESMGQADDAVLTTLVEKYGGLMFVEVVDHATNVGGK